MCDEYSLSARLIYCNESRWATDYIQIQEVPQLPMWLSGEEPAYRRLRFDPWVRKIPWRRKWQPTPVFLPGESHGQRSLAVYSPWGCKETWLKQISLQWLPYRTLWVYIAFVLNLKFASRKVNLVSCISICHLKVKNISFIHSFLKYEWPWRK